MNGIVYKGSSGPQRWHMPGDHGERKQMKKKR